MQKYGEIIDARLHELEYESKVRFLKTHSRTSERWSFEADKERQEKREGKEAYP